MKSKLLLAAGLILVLLPLWAQQAPPPPSPHDPVAENVFPPELIMAHQNAISLQDSQKTYIRAEILKAQTRFTELQWQLQDVMEALVTLLKQLKADETQVLAQLDKVLNSEREIKRTQLMLMVRIKNNLTPDQQAKLHKIRSEARKF